MPARPYIPSTLPGSWLWSSRNLAHANLYVLFFLPRRLMIEVNALRKSASDHSSKPNCPLPPLRPALAMRGASREAK